MKKFIAPLALGTVVFFSLYACMTSSNGSGDSHLLLEWDEPVAQLNQSTHILTTRQIDYSCENGQAVGDTELNVQNYHLAGGKLYMWDPGECGATIYSGTSSTIIGTWALDAFTEVAIPSAVRPTNCSGTVTGNDTSGLASSGQFFQNAAFSADISQSKAHLKLSGDLCFASLFSEEFTTEGSSVIQVVSSSCSSVQIKAVQTNQTATLTTSFSNNDLNVVFKSGSKTCNLSEPFPIPNVVPSCPANNSSTDSAFAVCIESTPFAGAAAKVSANSGTAWSSQMTSAIRKSLRRPRF